MERDKSAPSGAGVSASADDVRAILASGRYSDLIGMLESIEVDFKAEPYRLSEPRQKFELAKDVSALANARGGAIVLGIKTKKHTTQPTDEAEALRPFPDHLLDATALMSILGDRIYPSVRGVSISRYRVDEPPGSLVLLDVPPQSESRGPFVTRKYVEDEAAKEDGAVFALFERRGADALPMSVPEAQMLMRDGRSLHAILDARDNLAEEAAVPPRDVIGDGEAHYRHAVLVEAGGFSQLPVFGLYVEPRPALDVSAMFASRLNRITELLFAPPEIRDGGFDLNTGAYPEMLRGESRRAVTAGYKGLELWRDGMLAFVTRADEEGISWAKPQPDTPLRINPFALIETVLLFCRLIRALCATAEQSPVTLRFRLHMERMCRDGRKPELPGRGPRTEARQLDSCELMLFLDAPFTMPPEQIAAELATSLYERFGFEHDRVPFIETTDATRMVSVAQLQAPRR